MGTSVKSSRVVILGAAGRDFHNFNMVYRDDPDSEVIAFTATQIPEIAGRRYPPSLAGQRYPQGIPIVDEAQLETLCRAWAGELELDLTWLQTDSEGDLVVMIHQAGDGAQMRQSSVVLLDEVIDAAIRGKQMPISAPEGP